MLQRLFVALPLPDDTISTLCAIAPTGAGIRAVPPAQMHLTLHFLGDTEAATVIAAIDPLTLPAVDITVAGTGSFQTRGGTVLWAGIAATTTLQTLHATIGNALAAAGQRIERRFHPHITLARCRSDARRDLIRTFLDRPLRLPTFAVPHCTLFSSTFGPRGVTHRAMRTWPLPSPNAI